MTLFNTFDMGLAHILLLSGVALAIVIALAVIHLMKQSTFTALAAIFIAAILGMAGSFFIDDFNDAETQRAQEAQRVWVESHGLSATEDTVAALKFPETPPTSDQEFGIAQVVENKAIISVHLAWENNEFVLYGTDGQPLEAIK